MPPSRIEVSVSMSSHIESDRIDSVGGGRARWKRASARPVCHSCHCTTAADDVFASYRFASDAGQSVTPCGKTSTAYVTVSSQRLNTRSLLSQKQGVTSHSLLSLQRPFDDDWANNALGTIADERELLTL